MTIAEAGGALPSAAGWPRRLAGYLLLQAVVVLACLLVQKLPPPEPPERYRLSQAVLSLGGTEQSVRLPYLLPGDAAGSGPAVFALSFERPAGARNEAWSVEVPRFVNRIEIAVNGNTILDSLRHPPANRPDRNMPEIAVIPAVLLDDGANQLTIRLHAWGPVAGFLDHVYAGPDEALRPAYDRRILLFQTLPVVVSAWQAILAVLLGVMWFKRRHEPAYGVLAAAMALGALQAFVAAPVAPSAYARLNAMLITSAPLEAACVLIFVITHLGLRCPRYYLAIFIPGLLTAAGALLGGPELARQMFLFAGTPTVILSVVLICLVLAHAAIMRGDGVAMLLGSAVTVILTFVVHDLLSALNLIADPIRVARLSFSVLLVALGIGLTWRFAKALNEVDSFAGRMVTLVREAEDRLRASMALEEERARATALANERTRLTRDLHDGLGGQLVSIVALSERGAPESKRIGDAARAALRDLRLVIDAMDDIDGDLMLALGAWRERTAAQLRPHGLDLEWHVQRPDGMPLHPELRPWHVIQVLRLLDEAVTNAAKHANATRVRVRIETIGDVAGGQHGRIVVEDDGQGFALCEDGRVAAGAPTAARGLANMHKRAARCGARLKVASGPGGTRVRLDLPRHFPESEPG